MIRVGIIGLGFIGTTVGPDIDGAEGADVIALADVDGTARRDGGDLFDVGPEHRYEDFREMFEQEPLDAVLIGTPHALHFEQTSAALERGLDVLCEKPLTTDLETATRLAALAEESAGSLTVGYQRRLWPSYREARTRIAEQLGQQRFITAEITQDWIRQQRGRWRADPALSGGGQLYDTGSHLVDIVLWMTDLTPTSVSAEMVFDDETTAAVDVQAVLNVTFAEGPVASISVSGNTPETREHIHVWGDEGAVYIDGEGFGPRSVETIDLPPLDPADRPGEARSKGEAFVESIRRGDPPFATAREAVVVTALTEAAYESARTGERIDVEPLDPEASER